VRPRFKMSERKRDDLLEGFLRATSSGDMEGLLALLATDVVLHTDGGGKAAAAPNLIHGQGMWLGAHWELRRNCCRRTWSIA
jgi:RNA polymerase sigma-70 factor, ECF subfamily